MLLLRSTPNKSRRRMSSFSLKNITLLHLKTRNTLPNDNVKPRDSLFRHLPPPKIGHVLTRLEPSCVINRDHAVSRRRYNIRTSDRFTGIRHRYDLDPELGRHFLREGLFVAVRWTVHPTRFDGSHATERLQKGPCHATRTDQTDDL